MEITPGGVELAGLSQALEPKSSGIPNGHGKMKVSPLATRQCFQLKMAVRRFDWPMPRPDVARVVKNRTLRVPLAHEPRHFLLELVDRLKAELLPGILIAGFQARRQHLFAAITARAGDGPNDVEKQAVSREGFQNFSSVLLDELTVGCVDAQRLVKAGFEWGRSDHPAFCVLSNPLGTARRRVMIPLDCEVDRRPDAPLVAGVDLLGK